MVQLPLSSIIVLQTHYDMTIITFERIYTN